MNNLFLNLKWQFILLQKNNIISISIGVTFIYGILFYFLSHLEHVDALLVGLVLNDPAVIGYFFIALGISSEIKHQILPAIFVSPVNIHHYLLSRTISLSLLGLVCSFGLGLFAQGSQLLLLPFSIGAFGICLLTALLGLIMLTYATDFLRFCMLSAPIFLLFVNLPLLDYLGAIDIGPIKYFLPIQGSLNLISSSIGQPDAQIPMLYNYLAPVGWIALLYYLAHRLFTNKIVHQ